MRMRGALPFLAAVALSGNGSGSILRTVTSHAEDPLLPTTSAPPRRLGCVGLLLGLALIAAALAGFVCYRIETFPARVREAFAAVAGVQPRVSVNEEVVYEESQSVLELAVVQREMVVERVTTSTWLGSTKRLRVRGVYRVKAGFDLKQPFSVDINGSWDQSVRVQMPPARLLSTELEKLDVLTVDNGLWNHVKPEEFADEVSALNIDARLKANEQGMIADAKKTFTDQLDEKIGPGHRVEVVTSPVGGGLKK